MERRKSLQGRIGDDPVDQSEGSPKRSVAVAVGGGGSTSPTKIGRQRGELAKRREPPPERVGDIPGDHF